MDLKVRSYSNPGDYKDQMDKIQKELKNHPANGFIERGFLNSLGSELIMNTDDPSSGFKSDLDAILKRYFKTMKVKTTQLEDFSLRVLSGT